MAKPVIQVYESAARISFNEKPFMDYLDQRIAELTNLVVYQEDSDRTRIMQGRAQELIELKKLFQDAPAVARKA